MCVCACACVCVCVCVRECVGVLCDVSFYSKWKVQIMHVGVYICLYSIGVEAMLP